MNKIKEELRQKLQGQLSDYNTQLDIDNAYSVVKNYSVLFSLFCAENYHTEFETWTKEPLPKGKIQDRKNYNIISVEDAYKIWENEI